MVRKVTPHPEYLNSSDFRLLKAENPLPLPTGNSLVQIPDKKTNDYPSGLSALMNPRT